MSDNKNNNTMEKNVIGQNISKILFEKNLSQAEAANKVTNFGCQTNQSTIARYISGEIKPSLKFIQAFCQALEVSADTVFGLNDNTAINIKEVTPLVVLSNLNLLLNQFNFKIEFNNDNSKVMLTTDNSHMIDFLFLLQKSRNYSIEQIDHFCQINKLQMLGKSITSVKDLYVIEQMNNFHEVKQDDFGFDEKAYIRQIVGELLEDYEIEQLDLKDVFAMQWEQLSTKEKERIAPELLQKYLNKGKGKKTDKGSDNNADKGSNNNADKSSGKKSDKDGSKSNNKNKI